MTAHVYETGVLPTKWFSQYHDWLRVQNTLTHWPGVKMLKISVDKGESSNKADKEQNKAV